MLIAFKPWHLSMMRLTAQVQSHLSSCDSAAIVSRLAAAGCAYTIVSDNGDILGVAGAAPMKDGNEAEVFVVASEDRHKHVVEFVSSVRLILDHAKERFARIEAIADEGVADRWFSWLGFLPVENVPGRWALAGRKN